MATPRRPKKDFSQEWKGTHSGIHTPATYIARTQEEWTKLWDSTHSNTFPAPAAPKLPEGKMAVGIFTGQANRSSDIRITRIEQQGDQTTLHWKAEGAPQTGGMMFAAVMYEPFLLKFVDKTDGPVRFARQEPANASPQPAYSAPDDLKKLPKPPKPY